ncbi:MAG: Tad domain-containing protein [Elusimicrobia bacterium]|nr:Tad domain-containing protein [Elusimicrobiota bacterium]
MAASRRIGWSRGQIAIPSLFVIPSLMLFVYLIYETAKLSREKIRHQFAVDAAAFVEMTNYADFLNRTAYVNGAFPQRIFAEGFAKGPKIPKKKDDSKYNTLYDILFCNGAFPRKEASSPDDAVGMRLDQVPEWDIKFSDGVDVCQGGDDRVTSQYGDWGDKNKPEPVMNHRCKGEAPNPDTGNCLDLITQQNAQDYYISWEDAQDIYKLYVQIYQLLGSVEDAQFSVFKRLTYTHTFFRKSYWLNTGSPIAEPDEGAKYFGAIKPKARCVGFMSITGNKPTHDPYQPYKWVTPTSPIKMPRTVTSELCDTEGLFQMAYVDKREMDQIKYPQGYDIVQHWNHPNNYFKVSFSDVCAELPGEPTPCVHSRISLTGTGSVWPNPTPKFQTRLFP